MRGFHVGCCAILAIVLCVDTTQSAYQGYGYGQQPAQSAYIPQFERLTPIPGVDFKVSYSDHIAINPLTVTISAHYLNIIHNILSIVKKNLYNPNLASLLEEHWDLMTGPKTLTNLFKNHMPPPEMPGQYPLQFPYGPNQIRY